MRAKQEEARKALGRITRSHQGVGPMLVQVYDNGSIPTTVGKFFACHVVNPGGVECEACTPTFDVESGTVFVLVVGPRSPIPGDKLIAESIGGRWIAETHQPVCTADAAHMCLCSCVNPIPKSFFFSDSLGSHTLTGGTAAFGAAWGATSTMVGIPLYTCVDTPCTFTTTGNLLVSYRLELHCSTATWVFSITWFACLCQDGTTLRYGTPLQSFSLTRTAPAIPFDCNDFSMLTFNVPTTGGTLATPGGGGLITVVP